MSRKQHPPATQGRCLLYVFRCFTMLCSSGLCLFVCKAVIQRPRLSFKPRSANETRSHDRVVLASAASRGYG